MSRRYISVEYIEWVSNMNHYDGDPVRAAFYQELLWDIKVEWSEVKQERDAAFEVMSALLNGNIIFSTRMATLKVSSMVFGGLG